MAHILQNHNEKTPVLFVYVFVFGLRNNSDRFGGNRAWQSSSLIIWTSLSHFKILRQLRLKWTNFFDQSDKETRVPFVSFLCCDQKVFTYILNETNFRIGIFWPNDVFVNLQSHILHARTSSEADLALQNQDTQR